MLLAENSPFSASRLCLFSLGRLLATPGALAAMALTQMDPVLLLARHVIGDWGDLRLEDRVANDRAVQAGDRILSAYILSTGEKIWIITEADRGSSTMLLPGEY